MKRKGGRRPTAYHPFLLRQLTPFFLLFLFLYWLPLAVISFFYSFFSSTRFTHPSSSSTSCRWIYRQLRAAHFFFLLFLLLFWLPKVAILYLSFSFLSFGSHFVQTILNEFGWSPGSDAGLGFANRTDSARVEL